VSPACSQDGNFSEAAFRDSVNAALANNIGNMLNRTLGLLRKYHASTLPVGASQAAGPDHPLRLVLDKQLAEAAAAYSR
jgi:methionyl-tRNA synthetase